MRNIVYYDVSGNCCRVNYNVVIECSKEICLLYRADYLPSHLQRLCFLSIFCILLLRPLSPGAGLQSIVISMSVCLSVHSRISKTTCPNFTKFFLLVICGCGSALWWQCNYLYTSSSVMMSCFHITGHVWCTAWLTARDVSQWEAMQRGVELQHLSSALLCIASRWLTSLGCKPRHTQQSLAVEANSAVHTGMKSAILNCLVFWMGSLNWQIDVFICNAFINGCSCKIKKPV